MELLTEEQKQEIIKKFQEKKILTVCPMCKHPHFTIADGYFTNSLQNEVGGIIFGGPTIPSIAIICNNCGFISQHALGVLGLLNKHNDAK